MQFTFIGYFECILGAIIVLRGSLRSAFLLLVMAGLFGGSAAIALPALGGSSIPPMELALLFVFILILAPAGGFRAVIPSALRANFWLAAFCVYGMAMAILAPRIFAGAMKVSPMRPIEGSGLFDTISLAPSPQNVTSAVYLLGTLLIAMATFVLVRHCRGGTKSLVRAAIAVGWAHVILGVLVAVADGTALGGLLDVLRNGNYAQLNQSYDGFVRIRGLFPESSGYAEFGFAWFVLNAELWYRSVSPKATGSVALGLAAVLFFSTSSTAYVGLGGYALWFLLRIVVIRTPTNGRRLVQTAAALLALAVVLAIAFAFSPGLPLRFLEVVRVMTVEKSASESGMQRLFWAQQGWEAFRVSWGFGIGPGSYRSSSFLLAILGSTGVIGTLTFLLYLLRVFQPARLSSYDKGSRLELSIGGAFAAAALLSQIPAAVSSPKPDPGNTFAMLAGAAIGLRPRRKTRADDHRESEGAPYDIERLAEFLLRAERGPVLTPLRSERGAGAGSIGSATLHLFQRARARAGRLIGNGELEKFRGSYRSYDEAIAAVSPQLIGGYDNAGLVDVAFDEMCKMHLWDYPVLFWLERLLPDHSLLIDAGGHMGTKFRAFAPYLTLPDDFVWAVYDLPSIVEEGARRAQADMLPALHFHSRTETLPAADVLLASGLFQYLDTGPAAFLARLPKMPRHLLLNKVATREGCTVVTLERFPDAEVPYHVRERTEFESELTGLGYVIRDKWQIPAFSRRHPAFGQSCSYGYYAVRDSSAGEGAVGTPRSGS